MSEQALNRILNELESVNKQFESVNKQFESVNKQFESVNKRLDRMETGQKALQNELHEFREETRADLQVLKAGQQGIRREISDRFREVGARSDKHEYSIDILNRRQLELEAAVAQLKNR